MAWFKRSGRDEQPQPADHTAAGEPAISEPAISDEPNEGERRWLEAQLALLAQAGVDPRDLDALAGCYDEALRSWQSAPPDQRGDPNQVINAVGIALGEHVRQHTDLEWVVAADQYGTEIALHRAVGNVVVYPTSMVAKRWAEGETGTLVWLAQATIKTVSDIARRVT